MIIGLTGGIASGKSLCSDWFAARAIAVVDADVVARTVVHTGSPVLGEIATAFGKDVLQADGSLNRALLRARAFVDEESRARLNAIMQPRIRERLLQELDGAVQQPYCILSVPLLLEYGLDRLCANAIVAWEPTRSAAAGCDRRHYCGTDSTRRTFAAFSFYCR